MYISSWLPTAARLYTPLAFCSSTRTGGLLIRKESLAIPPFDALSVTKMLTSLSYSRNLCEKVIVCYLGEFVMFDRSSALGSLLCFCVRLTTCLVKSLVFVTPSFNGRGSKELFLFLSAWASYMTRLIFKVTFFWSSSSDPLLCSADTLFFIAIWLSSRSPKFWLREVSAASMILSASLISVLLFSS